MIILTINGLNSQVKGIGWLNGLKKKKDPTICYLQAVDTHTLKEEEGKMFYANRTQKRIKVAILISDKTYFKSKTVKRDKESHYILIKRSVHQED
jgi:hypothetical protein